MRNAFNKKISAVLLKISLLRCIDVTIFWILTQKKHFLRLFTIKTSNSNNITRNFFFFAIKRINGAVVGMSAKNEQHQTNHRQPKHSMRDVA